MTDAQAVAMPPRATYRVLWWAGIVGLVGVWTALLILRPDVTGKPFGVDAMAYHSAPLDDPYDGPQVGLPGAYLYPPPFLQAITPLRLLPWEAFIVLWLALELIALAWLITPPLALMALAIPFVLAEVTIGNVHLFMAVAIVLAVHRYPAAWAFLALTKPTVAVVGAWHLFRGEWRKVGLAAGVTLGIVTVSAIIAPDMWIAWIERMRGDTGTAGPAWMILFGVRIVLALLLVAFAAWRGRPAFLSVAAFLALPITWPEAITLFAAIPRLARWRRR